MKIAIATDHRGRDLKYEIIDRIKNEFEIIDCSLENTDIDDYPDFAFIVGEKVASGLAQFGVLICGTGIGMSIAANKVKGIRAAHCSSLEQAHLAKEHNNANIIALSYKQDIKELKSMIEEFINTPFSNEERHARRVDKIKAMEK